MLVEFKTCLGLEVNIYYTTDIGPKKRHKFSLHDYKKNYTFSDFTIILFYMD